MTNLSAFALHPRSVLLAAQASRGMLPVCDHYSGVEARMRKSLQLQAEMTEEFGACVFDVTLDCEDGAPAGREAEHAALVGELALSAPAKARVGVRVHPVDHPAFTQDLAAILPRAGHRLAYVMLPKVESVHDVTRAEEALLSIYPQGLPLHALIESPAAVHRAFEIAAHPRVESLSFGLIDFVSAHAGAIPAQAFGKVPSHCVVTEFNDAAALRQAACRAAQQLGYTRMWSIHPAQIRPILEAFAPDERQIDEATAILLAAQQAHWGPISHQGRLHDRASYRHYWQLLERAHATGRALPREARAWFPH